MIFRRNPLINLAVLYILISVLVSVVGQLLLKKGMDDIGQLTLSLPWRQLGAMLWRTGTNPFVFIGLVVNLIAIIFWLVALSNVDLSYAYPFVSLSYVVMLIASWLLLKENITPIRLLGTFVICLGVFIIYRD
jgi:drug/metabolite transporter (DMT)-like permease